MGNSNDTSNTSKTRNTGQKRDFHTVCAYFRPFWCSVVTSITFCMNLSDLENNTKNLKKSKNN